MSKKGPENGKSRVTLGLVGLLVLALCFNVTARVTNQGYSNYKNAPNPTSFPANFQKLNSQLAPVPPNGSGFRILDNAAFSLGGDWWEVQKIANAVYRITMTAKDNLPADCTATAVGSHVLLTAQHCLDGAVLGRGVEVVNPNHRHRHTITDLRSFSETDQVLLLVDGPPLRWIPVGRPAPRQAWEVVTLAGYPVINPSGNDLVVRTTPVTHQNLDGLPEAMFGVDALAARGDSGSGVFRRDTLVVGTVIQALDASKAPLKSEKTPMAVVAGISRELWQAWVSMVNR